VVDATLGLGGHSEAMLERFPGVTLVGLDRDTDALERSGRRLAAYEGRTLLVHAVYDELPRVLADAGLPSIDGVLFDLGVSSMQLDDADRGFAYSQDAPLDMRMDQTRGITAAEVLNTYSAQDIARVLREYGEERFARRIADAVVRERAKEPFDTSARLVDLVRESIPAPARRTGGNPAKRTFQALRIEVNGELEVLERALPAAVDALTVGGRIVVMSYQSLEDRITKRVLAGYASTDVPPDLPFVPEGHEPELRLVTRGSEKASEQEIAENPRAASVRLRAAERMRAAA
jgi:16S rRNA (cytosine1402-N4)-methyltransferase